MYYCIAMQIFQPLQNLPSILPNDLIKIRNESVSLLQVKSQKTAWLMVTYCLQEWTEFSKKRLDRPSRNKLQQDIQCVFLTDSPEVPLLKSQEVDQTTAV